VAKVRVYELAKEFGVESKAVMAKLQEMGEFVRSASSTIEAPVVRRLKEAFSAEAQKQGPAEKVASRPTAPTAGENGSRTAPAGPAAAVDGAAAPAAPVTPAPAVPSPSAPATSVSGLISIFQPVRRWASRAFCPSFPIASESW